MGSSSCTWTAVFFNPWEEGRTGSRREGLKKTDEGRSPSCCYKTCQWWNHHPRPSSKFFAGPSLGQTSSNTSLRRVPLFTLEGASASASNSSRLTNSRSMGRGSSNQVWIGKIVLIRCQKQKTCRSEFLPSISLVSEGGRHKLTDFIECFFEVSPGPLSWWITTGNYSPIRRCVPHLVPITTWWPIPLSESNNGGFTDVLSDRSDRHHCKGFRLVVLFVLPHRFAIPWLKNGNKLFGTKMISHFWNLCRACPALEVDKVTLFSRGVITAIKDQLNECLGGIRNVPE